MAMHDVDKSSDNRLLPTPNVVDSVGNRMAHGTTAFTLKTASTDSDSPILVVRDGRILLKKEGNTYVDVSDGNFAVYDTDSTNNVMLGRLPDGSGGFVASKAGTNVDDLF